MVEPNPKDAISIHAPARGATHPRISLVVLNPHFNPRTREGCDDTVDVKVDYDGVFQSTHPRGVRLPETSVNLAMMIISIHAPARGATTDQ